MMNENSIKISEPERKREWVWLQYWHAAGLLLYVHPNHMGIGVKAEAGIEKSESRHSLAVCCDWRDFVVCYEDSFRKMTPLSKEIWYGSVMKSTWATIGGKMGLDFYRKVHAAPYVHPVQEGVCAETAYSKGGAPDVSLTFFSLAPVHFHRRCQHS